MRIRDLWATFSDYWFKPTSPYPLSTFRILFGLCVFATLLLLHSDWLSWFGVNGWITMDTIDKAESGLRLNLFALVPHDDRWIVGLYWFLLVASITLTLGLGTRLSSVIIYLGLNSLNQRLPLILHSGDTFLRIASFFMIFAPSGSAMSLDRLIRNYRYPPRNSTIQLISPWAQRLIQYQLVIIYAASFWWKAKGATWWDGSAIFYVMHLREIQRFPIPSFFHNVWLFRPIAWAVMAFEFLFPVLVWFKRFRGPILLAGLLFHLCLEYALNIPMFQWDMLAAYVLFIDAAPLRRLAIRTGTAESAITASI